MIILFMLMHFLHKTPKFMSPLTMGFNLIMWSVVLSLMMYYKSQNTINSILMIMIYTGGLLIMFMYMCCMSPNLNINYSNKNYKTIFCLITPFILYFLNKNLMNTNNYMPFEWMDSYYYSFNHIFLISFLIWFIYYWSMMISIMNPSPMWSS
uniref:NADH dehydrogenase subunit 6 n=1 Tax=Chordodes sp. VVA-2019 TaxID=2586751 RepID=A0A514ABW4_9BILA|nr:NADH dehydrogenase subunit 6 [Chordodes sp. VVA-2019]